MDEIDFCRVSMGLKKAKRGSRFVSLFLLRSVVGVAAFSLGSLWNDKLLFVAHLSVAIESKSHI